MARFNNEDTRVRKFIENIDIQRRGICDNTTIVKDLQDFFKLYQEVKSITNEYIELYEATGDEQYKIEMEEYLKEEKDYVDLINSLLAKLNDSIVLDESLNNLEKDKKLKEDFEYVRVMVRYQDYERRLAIIKDKVGKDYKTNEDYKNIEAKLTIFKGQVATAMIKLFAYEEMKKQIKVDSRVLIDEKEDIDDKIEYIIKKIQEIEGLPSNDRIEINGQTIPSIYKPLYLELVALLDNLKTKQQINADSTFAKMSYMLSDEFEQKLINEAKGKTEDPNKVKEFVSQDFIDELRKISFENDVYPVKEQNSGDNIVADTQFKEDENQATNSLDLDKLSQAIESFIPEINKETEKYVSDADKIESILKEMRVLIVRDKTIDKVGIETVVLPTNEVVNIKVESVPTYKRLYESFLNCTNEATSNITIDMTKERIFKNIKFLVRYGKKDEKTKEELRKQYKIYREIKKSEHFSSITGIFDTLKIAGINKEDKKFYKEAIKNPKRFAKEKRYSDSDKKNFLEDCSNILAEARTSLTIVETQGLKKSKYKLIKIMKGPKARIGAISNDLETLKEAINKLMKENKIAIKSFASKDAKVHKIKKVRKSKNRKNLWLNLRKKTCQVAMITSLGFLLYKGATSNLTIPDVFAQTNKDIEQEMTSTQVEEVIPDTKRDLELEKIAREIYNRANINKKEKDITNKNNIIKPKPAEKEEYHINLEDKFTVDEAAPIYTNYIDASNETNGLKSKVSNEITFEGSGVAYDYNGNIVWLSGQDPDFEAKREAYINNGAKETAVRLDNNLGFYNIDDINIERSR